MSLIEIRVNGRYKLGPKIGNGSFGSIYIATNVQSHSDVAVKMEEKKRKNPHLFYEAKILQSLQGGIGIPTLYWFGQEGDYNILVMDLLSHNLEYCFQLCERKFSLKTVLMIADQLISNIEYIHFKNYLHRDIKPQNFLLGQNKKSHVIFTIDFGLSKKYRNPRTFEHITFKENRPLIGTARYASINTHKGFEQSRRDDLESIGYMLVYFLQGSLPWQGLAAKTKEERFRKIKEKKIACSLEELCSNIPQAFSAYLTYCRGLKFDEKPDYGYLKKLFKELFVKEGYEFDYVYDWVLIPVERRSAFSLEVFA